ncbi:type II toxin-antitoxin system RelE/ParE family toxin [Candidatus Woesearchaeota archaeon]|nr:type II toxin-antitoxin system RelE/ParE family toxin [Candidatus Woesearchaeota archaeon]
MAYEVLFVDEIEDDFIEIGLDDASILSIKDRVERTAQHPKPILLTERVLNTPLRKMSFGKFRLFLHVVEPTQVIYCLALRHHNNCYKPEELRAVLNILRKVNTD